MRNINIGNWRSPVAPPRHAPWKESEERGTTEMRAARRALPRDTRRATTTRHTRYIPARIRKLPVRHYRNSSLLSCISVRFGSSLAIIAPSRESLHECVTLTARLISRRYTQAAGGARRGACDIVPEKCPSGYFIPSDCNRTTYVPRSLLVDCGRW